jgi:hypothetical protein
VGIIIRDWIDCSIIIHRQTNSFTSNIRALLDRQLEREIQKDSDD